MKRHSKGFTLVELIIVIAVIGVLAAILIPVFSNVIKKANSKSALADARNAVSVYVTESMDRRAHGDTSAPSMITIIVQKAGRWFVYGFDTAVSNSIMSANSNDNGGLEASSFTDLVNRYSWNGLHPGVDYNPNVDQATLDGYTLEDDGAFYLQTYDANGSAQNQNMRGFVGTTERYLRLDEEVTESDGTKYGYNLELAGNSDDRAIFAGCLVGSAYTIIANENGEMPNTDPAITAYTITYDINLPAGLEATVNGNPVQTSYSVSVGGEHAIQGSPVVVGDTNGDHVFGGWFEGSVQQTGVMSNIQENHTLQAHWTHLQTVTVTLLTEYENLSHETANITYDQKYSGFGDGLTMTAREDFSLNTIVDALHVDESSIPSGMYFNGWMIKKGTADEYGYNSGNTQTVGAQNVTIRPVIGPLEYTITFVADGNTVATFTKQWGQSVEFPTTDPTSATNGHFKYWVYNEGHYTDTYPETITGDMEFVAEFGWYVVTFRGVLGEEIATTHTHDTYDIPDINSLTATAGHHITGWTVSAGADPSTCPTSGTYTALKNNITITATEDWNYYTVVYTDGHTDGYQGGTAGIVQVSGNNSQSVRHGNNATAPAENPTWGVHTFNHWSRSNENITATNNGDTVVIYAVWDDPVTITYDKGTIPEAVTAFTESFEIMKGTNHLVQGGIASTVSNSDYVFDGWYWGGDEVSGEIGPLNSDITITAHWTQLQYVTVTLETEYTDLQHNTQNVTYSAKPGFTGLTKQAREDASLNDIIDSLVVDPSSIAEGMEFKGWEIKKGTAAYAAYNSGTAYTVGDEAVSIKPIIGPLTFTITFKNGGDTVKTYEADWGTTVQFPSNEQIAAMTGTGHFKYWVYNENDYTNSYPNPISGNMTFNAYWGDYIVTFYDIDGTTIAATHTNGTDEYIVPAISELHPTAGHHITGWTVAPTGAPAVGAAGSTYTADRDGISITATEDWNYYNVYYTDGHTTGYDSTSNPQGIVQVGGNNSQSVRHGQNATAPASDPTWGNYTFDHWSSNGQNITAGNHGDTVIIHAVWENPVTITYSKGAIPENVVTVNDTAMQASYEIVKGGDHVVQANLKSAVANSAWVFNGWEDESHNPVSGVLTGVTSNMTITATWTQLADVTATLTTAFTDLNSQSQNVTYSNLAGFSGSPLTQTVRQGTNLNTIIDALVVNPSSIPTGMEHSGWEVNMGSGFASYDSSAPHIVGTSDITINPIIGPLSFTVKFMNGSTTVKEDTYTWNQTITFPSAPASSAGNHFKGWDYGGTLYQNSYPNGVTSDMTFNASFGAWVVKFYNPNGTEITGVSHTNDTYNVPSPTISAHYHHTGWTVANGGANNTLALGASTYTAVQDNVSITATQALDQYTVTFKDSLTGNAYSSGVTAVQNVGWNTTATNPGPLADTSTHEFVRWATAQNGSTAFDFSTAITADTVVWAVWQEKASGYTITYTSGYGDPYVISGVEAGSTHNVLTMEEAGLKVGNSQTGVLYWDCSNGTSYSPAGNYIASAGSSTAAAASMANSVTVNSNLTFTAHTISSGGTSSSTEAFTFTFTPAGGAGGTRTFVTGYKYRAASAGHTFVDPSAYGFTAPTGKMFDHWQMTYRDYQANLPTKTTFVVGDTLNTQRGFYFIPVYTDAPGLTITFTDGASGVYNVTNNNGNSLDGTIYFVGDDGEEFILPSIAECGFTAPSGKTFDKWVLTSGDADPSEGVAGESGIVNTEDSVYEVQWKDAPANVTYTVRIYDTWMGTTTNVGTAQAPAVNPTWADVKGSVSGLPQYWYTADSATPATTSGTTITFNGSQYVTTTAADDQYSPLPTYTAYTGTGKQFQCITSLASLNKINTSTANLSKNYYLMTDITDTTNNFTPICKVSGEFYDFSGVFDGGNHAINIKAYYDAKNYVGIFGQTSGVVKNISNTISKASQIGGSQFVGGIVGYVGSTGKVLNCYVYTTVQQGMIAGDSYIGGICGYNDGLVQYCRCSTTKTVAIKGDYNGSICGQNEGTISRCTGYSDPCGWANGECVGGIVGCLEGSNAIVEECAYTGRVCYGQNYSTVYGTGGIVGASNEGSTFYIKNSYYYNTSSGMICGKNAVGGIQGHCEGNLHWWYTYACLPGVDSANSQASIDAGYFIPDSYDFKQSYAVTSFSQLSSKDKSQWDTTNIWTLSGTPYTLKRARYS